MSAPTTTSATIAMASAMPRSFFSTCFIRDSLRFTRDPPVSCTGWEALSPVRTADCSAAPPKYRYYRPCNPARRSRHCGSATPCVNVTPFAPVSGPIIGWIVPPDAGLRCPKYQLVSGAGAWYSS